MCVPLKFFMQNASSSSSLSRFSRRQNVHSTEAYTGRPLLFFQGLDRTARPNIVSRLCPHIAPQPACLTSFNVVYTLCTYIYNTYICNGFLNLCNVFPSELPLPEIPMLSDIPEGHFRPVQLSQSPVVMINGRHE